LTRDDFRVANNGKPQTIVFFRHRDCALGAVPTLTPNKFSRRSGAGVRA
jgi:hypothetical protein